MPSNAKRSRLEEFGRTLALGGILHPLREIALDLLPSAMSQITLLSGSRLGVPQRTMYSIRFLSLRFE